MPYPRTVVARRLRHDRAVILVGELFTLTGVRLSGHIALLLGR